MSRMTRYRISVGDIHDEAAVNTVLTRLNAAGYPVDSTEVWDGGPESSFYGEAQLPADAWQRHHENVRKALPPSVRLLDTAWKDIEPDGTWDAEICE